MSCYACNTHDLFFFWPLDYCFFKLKHYIPSDFSILNASPMTFFPVGFGERVLTCHGTIWWRIR